MTETFAIWFGLMFFTILFTAPLYYLGAVANFCIWAWYKWWFEQVVESGLERHSENVVMPTIAGISGACIGLGLDRLTSDSDGIGAVLVTFGIGISVAMGTLELIRLRSPSSARLIHEALYQGRDSDAALAVLRKRARDPEWLVVGSGASWTVADKSGVKRFNYRKVWPWLWGVALILTILGRRFLLHSQGVASYILGVLATSAPVAYFGAARLKWESRTPMLNSFIGRIELVHRGSEAIESPSSTQGCSLPDALPTIVIGGLGVVAGWLMRGARRERN
ncbi:hypothetical protein [Streptomyces violaceus]|uniref:Uncharacterized protein n=1 Tax=Streptomyces violaceus TaxID=1936 RepID=A0ABY9UAG6_STRVL|nr:hypothetical protein [Streptomyces janthinus]WND19893.1 hypothetical protein RI060_22190 [Streptomyces janthinus]